MRIKKPEARIVLDIFSLFSPEKFSEKEIKLIHKILDRYPEFRYYRFLVEDAQKKEPEIEYDPEVQYARERKM